MVAGTRSSRLEKFRHRHAGAFVRAADCTFLGSRGAGRTDSGCGDLTAVALGLAGWVAITIVPALARRTSLRWFVYQVDYRLTREGIIYLGAVFVLVLAAVNTGNNLLFMILACSLAGILISGILSRVVLTGVELKFDMPDIFLPSSRCWRSWNCGTRSRPGRRSRCW